MKNCWASNMNECEGKINKEHFITQALLAPSINTTNYILGKELEIGKGSLNFKYLYAKHNSFLSCYDSEAVKLKNAILFPDSFSGKLNGVLVEKWILKMIVGFSKSKKLTFANEELVKKVIFSNEKLTKPLGLYFLINDINEGLQDESFTFIPIVNEKEEINMFLLRLWGLKFLIMFENIEWFKNRKNFTYNGVIENLSEYDNPKTWSDLTPVYRPIKISFKNKGISLELKYD